MRFVDTNVLLYAVSRDPEEQDKAQRANDILGARDVALSVQVLQEFYVQATRESRPDPLAHEQAASLVESFLRFPVQPITTEVMLAAMATRQRFGISYWDAAILEAGRSLGCEVVLSEDLSDGEDYAGRSGREPLPQRRVTSMMPDLWPGRRVRFRPRRRWSSSGMRRSLTEHRHIRGGLHRCAATRRRVLERSEPALDRGAVSRIFVAASRGVSPSKRGSGCDGTARR